MIILEYNDDLYDITILPYSFAKYFMYEDIINPEDTILDGDSYSDPFDSRVNINPYLTNLINTLNNLPYVYNCETHYARQSVTRGISNYINVEFNHPEDISNSELNKLYKLTLRFSDHDAPKDDTGKEINLFPENGPFKTLKIVGIKANDISKEGYNLFMGTLPEIVDSIDDFEISEFGEKITFPDSGGDENTDDI